MCALNDVNFKLVGRVLFCSKSQAAIVPKLLGSRPTAEVAFKT